VNCRSLCVMTQASAGPAGLEVYQDILRDR
jgi:hypothetical protein